MNVRNYHKTFVSGILVVFAMGMVVLILGCRATQPATGNTTAEGVTSSQIVTDSGEAQYVRSVAQFTSTSVSQLRERIMSNHKTLVFLG